MVRRMKRLQIHIEQQLDDALAVAAAQQGTSKAALIRALMRRRRMREALAFDGDFSAAGFVEQRP